MYGSRGQAEHHKPRIRSWGACTIKDKEDILSTIKGKADTLSFIGDCCMKIIDPLSTGVPHAQRVCAT